MKQNEAVKRKEVQQRGADDETGGKGTESERGEREGESEGVVAAEAEAGEGGRRAGTTEEGAAAIGKLILGEIAGQLEGSGRVEEAKEFENGVGEREERTAEGEKTEASERLEVRNRSSS